MDYYKPYSYLDIFMDFMPNSKPQRNRPDLAPKKDQPRNERCKCGSGKKYKVCCGK